MGELTKQPNIGAVLEQKLNQVGIETIDELKKLGSMEAFRKIRIIDNTACFNMLCALEGAIQGIRWHHLSESDKRRLKEFFEKL